MATTQIGAASQQVLGRLQSAPRRNELAIIRPLEPADCQPDLALSRHLPQFWSGIVETGKRRQLRKALPLALRAQIEERISILNQVLAPADDRGAIEIAVGAMLAGFSSARATGDDAVGILAQYVSVLSPLPLWAIERICDAYSHMRITGQSREFPPSAASVYDKARELYVESLKDEQAELAAILVASVERI